MADVSLADDTNNISVYKTIFMRRLTMKSPKSHTVFQVRGLPAFRSVANPAWSTVKSYSDL